MKLKSAVLVLSLLLGISVAAFAYVVGMAPWCTVDDYGNYACYYYSIGQAQQACQYQMGGCVISRHP